MVTPLLLSQAALAISLNDPAAAAAGGIANYYDSTNQYPNVVAIDIPGNGQNGQTCTGTLINARTILTAAHCFYNANTGSWIGGPTSTNPSLGIPSVSFLPSNAFSDPHPTGATSAAAHNAYNSITAGNDIAVISLAKPITTIAPVTLSGTTPAVGTTMTIAGYGNFGTGTNCCQASDGKRRIATIEFGAYGSGSIIGYGSAPFLLAQFRNPSDPYGQSNPNLNIFNLTVPTSQYEGGTVSGDSGGPVFITTPNGLVQIGELSGGANPAYPPATNCNGGLAPNPCKIGIYGDGSAWTPISLYLEWLAENNPLRMVSSKAGNFNWSNPGAWSDSSPDAANPNGAAPNNTNGNVSDYQTQVARYYQVTLSNPGAITLDTSPTVDTLMISGAHAQLILPEGFTLSTVLSTTLSAGTLSMAGGTLSSPQVLVDGGLLAGNGTIVANDSTNVSNPGVFNTGGTVMPVGTLGIQGNYSQSGGLLAYQVSPSSASGTLAVTGAAALGGALAVTVTPGLYANSTRYASIVTAGSVAGQFAQVASSSVFLPAAATYNPTSVDLTLNRIPFGAVPGLSGNQRAVGNGLEGAYSTNLTGQQAVFYGNILASPTTNVLTQLSGESNAGAGQIAAFEFTNQFLLLMLNPFGENRGGFGAGSGPAGDLVSGFAPERAVSPNIARAYAAVSPDGRAATYWTPRWNVWASAFGGANNTNGDPNGAGTHSFAARTGGIAAGLDYKVTPDTLIGFALAGGDTTWGLAQGLGGGHSDVFQAGLYGSQLYGRAYLSGALAFANYGTATSRSVVVTGIDTLNANFNAQSWAGRAEAGYKFAWAPVNLTPYAAVQAQSFHTPGFSEASSSGSNLYGLSYASHTGGVTRAELGSWVSNSYSLAGEAVAVVFGRAAWAHDWQEDLQAAATFLTVPTAAFIVNGAKPAANLAVVTAGAELRLAQGISLMGKFDGEFGSGTSTYAGTARVRYAW